GRDAPLGLAARCPAPKRRTMGAFPRARARTRSAADLTGEVPETSGRSGDSSFRVSLQEVLDQRGTASWKGFSLLRRYRSENPAPARILARQIRSVAWAARPDFESRRVRFAFVSSASLANLEDAVTLESL